MTCSEFRKLGLRDGDLVAIFGNGLHCRPFHMAPKSLCWAIGELNMLHVLDSFAFPARSMYETYGNIRGRFTFISPSTYFLVDRETRRWLDETDRIQVVGKYRVEF